MNGPVQISVMIFVSRYVKCNRMKRLTIMRQYLNPAENGNGSTMSMWTREKRFDSVGQGVKGVKL